MSVAFALWKKVLGLQPHDGRKGEATNNDSLSYIRSTLVLLGMLDLAAIEKDREDDGVEASYGHSFGKSIECLVAHDNYTNNMENIWHMATTNDRINHSSTQTGSDGTRLS